MTKPVPPELHKPRVWKGWRDSPIANENRDAVRAALPGTVAEISAASGIHRALVYRHLVTLEHMGECHIGRNDKNPRGGRPIAFWVRGPRPAGQPSMKELAKGVRGKRAQAYRGKATAVPLSQAMSAWR